MAENKRSFVAYSDWNGMFKALPNEVAGELIKHIFSYVNDENPKTDNYVINALFEQVKATLKRDLQKWETKRDQRSEAGKASAKKRAEIKEQESTSVETRSTKSNEPTRKPTVSVSGSVSVNDILSEYSEKEFLEDWGIIRKKLRNLPTNIPRLKPFDLINFNKYKKDYSREQFQEAMRGLFSQEVINFTSMITQPTHFLENVEKYYNAFISKDFKQYGSKQIQH